MQWIDSPSEWLAAIVDSSEDAVVGKTLDSIIRSWNVGAAQMFGYSAKEVIGKSVLILIPPELHHEEIEIVTRLSHGERIRHFETVRMRKDHSRIEVSLSVSPIRDSSGRIVGAAKIARDLTEANRLRQAERDLTEELQAQAAELELQMEAVQNLQSELEQTNHELREALSMAQASQRLAEEANEAKARFLAMMSHELRTPLNAIAGYVDLLELGLRGPLTSEQRSDVERIKASQLTLRRLVDDVLGFAKVESGNVEFHSGDVAINDVIANLETFFAPALAKKKLTYRFRPCDGAVVHADRDKVQQILLNLISNAVKFTDTGEITVRCQLRDRVVAVEVSDSGRGIPADYIEKVFEPFVQGPGTARTIEGTGLGLSISRQLARAMQGDVIAESTVGKGSTFTLLLPRV